MGLIPGWVKPKTVKMVPPGLPAWLSVFRVGLGGGGGVGAPNDSRLQYRGCPPLPQGMMGQMQETNVTSFGIVIMSRTFRYILI